FPTIYHKAGLNNPIMTRKRYKRERQAALSRLGTGLFALNGEEHKQQRRLLMPAFHKKRIETYLDKMVELTHSMLSDWKVGETRDVAYDMMLLTMYIACETLLGSGLDRNGKRLAELLQETLR